MSPNKGFLKTEINKPTTAVDIPQNAIFVFEQFSD